SCGRHCQTSVTSPLRSIPPELRPAAGVLLLYAVGAAAVLYGVGRGSAKVSLTARRNRGFPMAKRVHRRPSEREISAAKWASAPGRSNSRLRELEAEALRRSIKCYG